MLSNCMVIVIFRRFICYANLYSCCRYYFQRRLLRWVWMPQLERLVLFNYQLNVWKMCSTRLLGGWDYGLGVPIILNLIFKKKKELVKRDSCENTEFFVCWLRIGFGLMYMKNWDQLGVCLRKVWGLKLEVDLRMQFELLVWFCGL